MSEPAADLEHLGNVVDLARARAQLASSSLKEQHQLASSAVDESEAFADVVRRVEDIDGSPLVDPGRTLCAQAYVSCPAGFVACVNDIELRSNVRSARALLVHKVRQSDHLKADRVILAAIEQEEQQDRGRTVNRCGCTHEACRYQDRCIEGLR